MNLLNSSGNIVDDAASIIDAYFNYSEVNTPLAPITDIPCSSSQLQTNIMSALADISTQDDSDLLSLINYTPKIYGTLSRKISKLDPTFMPFAECIVAFIDQWCEAGGAGDGPQYGYEIISTTRSWYVQQQIITGNEYRENGLSWSLYGFGLSINVYYLVDDQLSDGDGTITKVKTCINFANGSAKKFIEDAQVWFSTHKTRTGKNIKIYGVYPDLKTAIKNGKYQLESDYLETDDTVFWGGLFSVYSNFTSWEYHPLMMPNEVWKLRQSYLNKCFVSDGNQNIMDLIEANESITYSEANDIIGSNTVLELLAYITGSNKKTITKYLSTVLEIMEEDLLSMYSLKTTINTTSQYQIPSLFAWASSNPASLSQTILKYRICGDMENAALFYLISNELTNSIAYDSNNVPYLTGTSSFTIVGDDYGSYYLTYSDVFGETIQVPLTTGYRLPCDYMPDSADFDLIDLSDDDSSTGSNANGDGNPLNNLGNAGDEISSLASQLIPNTHGINEFGPLSNIGIDPKKAYYNADTLADSLYRSKNYNEMITPPMSIDLAKSTAVLDITTIGKRFAAELTSSVNEMIQPDKV